MHVSAKCLKEDTKKRIENIKEKLEGHSKEVKSRRSMCWKSGWWRQAHRLWQANGMAEGDASKKIATCWSEAAGGGDQILIQAGYKADEDKS